MASGAETAAAVGAAGFAGAVVGTAVSGGGLGAGAAAIVVRVGAAVNAAVAAGRGVAVGCGIAVAVGLGGAVAVGGGGAGVAVGGGGAASGSGAVGVAVGTGEWAGLAGRVAEGVGLEIGWGIVAVVVGVAVGATGEGSGGASGAGVGVRSRATVILGPQEAAARRKTGRTRQAATRRHASACRCRLILANPGPTIPERPRWTEVYPRRRSRWGPGPASSLLGGTARRALRLIGNASMAIEIARVGSGRPAAGTMRRPLPRVIAKKRRRWLFAAALVLGFSLLGCRGETARARAREIRLSFLVAASERVDWAPIAERFRASRPGVRVELVEGPNATDLRENLYTAALLARDDTFDLVSMDVVWTPKFAAAGWLLPLDGEFSSDELSRLLAADVEAGRYRGRLYRIPVRTDVGVLYYRSDLLRAAGLPAPATFAALAATARALQSPPERWGFLFQGAQYEGLVCTYLEVLVGHGGFWVDPTTLEVGLDRPEAVAALDFLRRARSEDPISPPGVTTYREEESRRLFQDGRAVFLRNWPYVWLLAQARGSLVSGRIGVAPMVRSPAGRSAATLGGWGFGVSRFSRNPGLAVEFIRYAVGLESQRALCRDTGYAPALREAYGDEELLAENPFLPQLLRIHESAVARPAIPRYALASDILQRHVSACLAGLAGTREALSAAARETRLLLGPPETAARGEKR